MERQIKQNYRDIWDFMLPLVFLVLVVVILGGAISCFYGKNRDPGSLLTGALMLFLSLLAMLLLIAVVLMQAGARWFITDTGLKRVMTSGGTQLIPWEQIYHIGSTRLGYFIRWRNPKKASVSEADREHRGILHLSKTDADELISLWQQKTSRELLTEGQVHFQATNRSSYSRLRQWGWAMAAVGAVLICWGAVNIARHYPSASWPSVDGKITFVERRFFPQRRHPSHWNEQLIFSCEYVVAGQTNRCDQYSLWQAAYQEPQETADIFAREHPRKASVKVFYDPKHPEQAVLLPGPDWRGDSSLMVLGSCAVAFGLLMRSAFGKLVRGQSVLKRGHAL